MKFSIPSDAKKWFENIAKDIFTIDFDILYICLMVGLAQRRRAEYDSDEMTELTDTFPGKYSGESRLLIALFLSTEIAASGIKMNEKKVIHEQIAKLSTPSNPTLLSQEGMRRLHGYIQYGFNAITEEFDSKPESADTFLKKYITLMNKQNTFSDNT